MTIFTLMAYFCTLRKAAVCIVASLMAASGFPALAVQCNDIFLVKPPDQLAGSIYLSSERTKDPFDNHLSHPRQGYLPVGTLLIEEKDNASDLLPDYVGFIAANGAQGLIKRDHIRRLGDLLTGSGRVIQCDSIKWIVIPVSPTDEVQVYRKHPRETNKPQNSFTFSRSAFRLVVVQTDMLEIKSFGPAKDLFYSVQYTENIGSQESPKWRLNNGFLKREDRRDPTLEELNGAYRFIRLDKCSFHPIKLIPRDSGSGILDLILARINASKDPKHEPPTMKNCGREESIKITKNISGELNLGALLQLGIGAEVIDESTILFPLDEKYILKSFHQVLVAPAQKVKVLKTIKCDGRTMHYTKKMRIILDSNVILAQMDVLEVLGNAFTTPIVSGSEDRPRDKMFVVPYDQADIFTPYARLEQFLTRLTNNIVDSKKSEQQRLIALLLDEMSLWER